MQERILSLALAVTGAGEGERPLLEMLCEAAAGFWTGRLRDGVSAEACAAAFCCAAAFTAAADLLTGRQGDGIRGFTAGELSIQSGSGADAAALAEGLRQAAERIMAPYGVEKDFAFLGVQG